MSFNTKVLEELHKMVVDAEEDTLNIISVGVAMADFAAYKEQVGRLYAYRRVREFFQIAAEIVEKME